MEQLRVIRVTEAARLLDCSKAKVYKMIHSGELASVDIGGCLRVPVLELEEMVSSQLPSRATRN